MEELTQEQIMLAKILTLIEEHERKQKEFIQAIDDFITNIETISENE